MNKTNLGPETHELTHQAQDDDSVSIEVLGTRMTVAIEAAEDAIQIWLAIAEDSVALR